MSEHPSELCARLAAELEAARAEENAEIERLLALASALNSERTDPRLARLHRALRRLAASGDERLALQRDEHLARLARSVRELEQLGREGRLAPLLRALLAAEGENPARLGEVLLDGLLAATRAERGFLLVYHPLSTEAEVIAARAFASRNLSVEEYDFSRTLVRRVLETGAPLLLTDASTDAAWSHQATVRRLLLRSVLVVPLQEGGRTLGAVYLEDNREPGAFTESDAQLAGQAAALAAAWLARRRLLPRLGGGDERVFVEPHRAVAEMVGETPAVVELRALIARLADLPATVLILGESGTGKELVARALHYESRRRDRPFVAINCAAIPELLLESELFGHERGAFTGATERYLGRLEQANGGTVFLDEVSELAYPLQAKLLRFLQSNELSRLGGAQTICLDVRVVAATSRDLKIQADAGKFHEALYYRLAVVPVQAPPLRARRGDIPLLAEHFREKLCALYGRELAFAPEVLALLAQLDWPGNARELENLVHRLVALVPHPTVELGDLPRELLGEPTMRVPLAAEATGLAGHPPPRTLDELRCLRATLHAELARAERSILDEAIRATGGNHTRAAEQLGLHRVTLQKLLRRSVASAAPDPSAAGLEPPSDL